MAATSQQAIKNKLDRRKSLRDIARENRIELLGGSKIDVVYGDPINDNVRQERIRYESMLNCIKHGKKIKADKPLGRTTRGKKRRGEDRTRNDFINEVLRQIKVRCKKKGIPFDINAEDIVIPAHCPVYGIPLFWTDKITDNTPSVDRFNPMKGYTKDNICVISYAANRHKNNATIEQLERLVTWMKQRG